MNVSEPDHISTEKPPGSRKGWARKLLLAGLVLIALLCGATTLFAGYSIFRPQIKDFVQGLNSNVTPTATPACDWMTLKIENTLLKYKNTWMSADGSTNIPVINPAAAYRIGSYERNYLFALPRKRANIRLFDSLKGGEQVKITFENCNSLYFALSAPQSGTPTNEMLLDQSKHWIIIYLLPDGSAHGATVRGEQLPAETPVP